MTLALLALLTLRCADESHLARIYRQSGINPRTTARICRPFAPKTTALTGAGSSE